MTNLCCNKLKRQILNSYALVNEKIQGFPDVTPAGAEVVETTVELAGTTPTAPGVETTTTEFIRLLSGAPAVSVLAYCADTSGTAVVPPPPAITDVLMPLVAGDTETTEPGTTAAAL